MLRLFVVLYIIMNFPVSKLGCQMWSGNVKWLYSQYDFIPDTIPKFIEFKKTKDTSVLNRNCIQIEERRVKIVNNKLIFSQALKHILCSGNNEIDYFDINSSKFYNLYNFNLNEGDTAISYCPNFQSLTYSRIDSIRTEMIGLRTLKVQYHRELFINNSTCNLSWRVIEGIGSVKYLFPQYAAVDPPEGGFLLCYKEDENIIYPEEHPECEFITASDDESKNELKVYPNPVNRKLYLKGGSIELALLFDVNGKQLIMSKSREIDLEEFQDGFYFIKLVSKSKTCSMKILKTK